MGSSQLEPGAGSQTHLWFEHKTQTRRASAAQAVAGAELVTFLLRARAMPRLKHHIHRFPRKAWRLRRSGPFNGLVRLSVPFHHSLPRFC